MNDLLKEDLLKLPTLLLGFILLGLGTILTMKSGLGMSSWGVLHQGMALVSIFTFGQITILLGLVILTLSVIFLKTKVGIGTIANVLIMGFIMDMFNNLITYEPNEYIAQGIVFLAGLFIMGFGRSVYISSRLGPGPRDGVFVGLSRVTQIDVKYVKPAIELTVLSIGYILGGTVGVGTLISMLFSGYIVQFFLMKLGFDSKTEKQRSIRAYLTKKAL